MAVLATRRPLPIAGRVIIVPLFLLSGKRLLCVVQLLLKPLMIQLRGGCSGPTGPCWGPTGLSILRGRHDTTRRLLPPLFTGLYLDMLDSEALLANRRRHMVEGPLISAARRAAAAVDLRDRHRLERKKGTCDGHVAAARAIAWMKRVQ